MRMIICKECGEEKKHWGKGLCKACYSRIWRQKQKPKDKECIRCKQLYPDTPEYFKLVRHFYSGTRNSNICTNCHNATLFKCKICNEILPINQFKKYSLICYHCTNKRSWMSVKSNDEKHAKVKARRRKYAHIAITNLTDLYIISILKSINPEQKTFTQDDIAIKRAEITAKRISWKKHTNSYVKQLIRKGIEYDDGTKMPAKKIKLNAIRKYRKLLLLKEIHKVLKSN